MFYKSKSCKSVNLEIVLQKHQPMGRNQESKPGIPGTTKLRRLEENLGVADMQLTEIDLKEINEAFSKIKV